MKTKVSHWIAFVIRFSISVKKAVEIFEILMIFITDFLFKFLALLCSLSLVSFLQCKIKNTIGYDTLYY